MVGFAAGQLFVGPTSDRFGRKPVLVISLSLFVVASGLAQSRRPRDVVGRPPVTGAGRQRLNVGWPRHRPGQLFVRPNRAGLAYVSTTLAIGPIIGPYSAV